MKFSRGGRGHDVDDVRVLALAEILIRDEVNGQRSRGSGEPLMETKGKSKLEKGGGGLLLGGN